jgi:serine/threonine-protein kinase
MEHLSGAPLTKLIRPGAKLPLAGLARVMLDVLAALDAAHAAGIIHRDLKPDNIFVTPEGNGKVLDFGIAKLRPEHGTTNTREGLVFGTPLYMSPEQVTDGELDARSDLYSLGVVLYEATTSEVPFTAASTYELLTAHIEQTPPAARTKRADLPEAFDALITKAMAKDRAQRFASAVEMASALAAAVKDLPNEPLVPPTSRRTSAPIAAPTPSGPITPPAPSAALTAAPTTGMRTYERYQVRARWPLFVIAGVVLGLVALVVVLLR